MAIGMDRIEARVQSLAGELRAKLGNIDNVEVCDKGEFKSGIVTFQKKGIDPEIIKQRLLEKYINMSVTGASYSRLDLPKRGLQSLVRASVHYYNTDDEIEKLCAAVRALA